MFIAQFHITLHHYSHLPFTTLLFAVFQSAPYTLPYVEELLLETNDFWVLIWHGFATRLHTDSSNLI